VARFGQQDDFHEQPTQHAIYGVDQHLLSGAGPTAASPLDTVPEPLEPATVPAAWYRRPAALTGWALLVLTLIALSGYGITELIRGGQGTSHTPGTSVTSTPPTTTTSPAAASTATPPTSSAAGPPAPQPTHQPARAPQQPPQSQPPPEQQQSLARQALHHHHLPQLPLDLQLPPDLPHLPSVITIPQIPNVITLPPGLS